VSVIVEKKTAEKLSSLLSESVKSFLE